MATSKPRFSITVSDEVYEAINTYQHENRLSTQTKAVQELIALGIEYLSARDKNKEPAPDYGGGPSSEIQELIGLWDAASPERRRLALDLLRLP